MILCTASGLTLGIQYCRVARLCKLTYIESDLFVYVLLAIFSGAGRSGVHEVGSYLISERLSCNSIQQP